MICRMLGMYERRTFHTKTVGKLWDKELLVFLYIVIHDSTLLAAESPISGEIPPFPHPSGAQGSKDGRGTTLTLILPDV